MKKGRIAMILMVIFFGCYSCKDKVPFFAERFYSFKVKNTTAKKIYFHLDLNKQFQYPDTTLPLEKPYMLKVEANSTYSMSSPKKWEDMINDMPSDTMALYVFDADVYENTDWNKVRADYMVLKRYNVTAEQVKNDNYTIVYP